VRELLKFQDRYEIRGITRDLFSNRKRSSLLAIELVSVGDLD
jgi:hypothetical protein